VSDDYSSSYDGIVKHRKTSSIDCPSDKNVLRIHSI